MTFAEIHSFASSWVAHPNDSGDVFDKMYDLLHDDPENAWLIIQEISSREMPEEVKADLAAGPLEDLLVLHGDSFIGRVETKARQDSKFNYLLGGVWQSSMKPDVWSRVEKIRTNVW